MAHSISAVLAALDPRVIAREAGLQHDEARVQFPLAQNTVKDFHEYQDIVVSYYTHHLRAVGRLGPTHEVPCAYGQIVQMLEKRLGVDMWSNDTLFRDACDGTNGGMRTVLDRIAHCLKLWDVEAYVEYHLDKCLNPLAFEARVEVIRQFMAECSPDLLPYLDTQHPERYAADCKRLVSAYIDAVFRTLASFRSS